MIAIDELARGGVVFGVAALPWGEAAVAIPVGIALGLHEAAVFGVAVAGNVASVLAMVVGIRQWPWARSVLLRRGLPRRISRVMASYGAAGLLAQAPVISGGHLAALAALYFGASVRTVAMWLTISVICWSVPITLLAYQGKRLFIGFLG